MKKQATKTKTERPVGPELLPVDAPQWLRTAFEGAERLRKAGVKLPSDLAMNHKYYAHRRKKRA